MIELEQTAQGIALIRLSGRLDAAAAPHVLARLMGALTEGQSRLAVDLSEVSFIDSTGLGTLVSVLKAARKAEGDLRLIAPSPQAQRLLRLTTLDRVFVTTNSLDEVWA
ncbi:STAS domain-containing protein [Microvirga terrestris]|uniref:Anti-sigma factor antagonist n=1 Tax=Microvirga terrestris TaxID=2791024 RepID=A0ABS0HWF5_9HYPH|nr:STAS domain-containing protein [Microvirga terrestris]MBF9197846.1 STAS domain-containing protein [Microvirga terrestris]